MVLLLDAVSSLDPLGELAKYGGFAIVLGWVVKGVITHLLNEIKVLKTDIKDKELLIEQKNKYLIEREKEMAKSLQDILNKQTENI